MHGMMRYEARCWYLATGCSEDSAIVFCLKSAVQHELAYEGLCCILNGESLWRNREECIEFHAQRCVKEYSSADMPMVLPSSQQSQEPIQRVFKIIHQWVPTYFTTNVMNAVN